MTAAAALALRPTMESLISTAEPVVAIVAGAPAWKDVEAIRSALGLLHPESWVVHGATTGADVIADDAARELGLYVRADRAAPGRSRSSGPLRNTKLCLMARNAAAALGRRVIVLAYPGTDSTWVWDLVRKATDAGWRVLLPAGGDE